MRLNWSWKFRPRNQNYCDAMKPAQIIRIVLLLAAIFAAGAITGRLTAPKPPALVVTADGRVSTSEVMLARMKRELRLTPEQERQFSTLLEELAREISPLPPASMERLEKFRSYTPQLEALLRPDQRADFERYVREAQRRSERWIRNHPQPDGARP